MSRSNFDKPFYVDVGTSIVAIRCASNHDVVIRYPLVFYPHTENLAKEVCDRMNKEVELGRPLRNCDVGTADEQINRFKIFCDSKSMKYCWGRGCRKCIAQWLQMPNEEGDAK